MTRLELIVELEKNRIPETAYNLDGPGSGECYCIEADRDGWIIYYSERGRRSSVVRYETEHEANEHFIEKLKAAFCR